MKRISHVVAACTIAMTLSSAPVLAQYSNEFAIAKVVKQGTTTHSIAGSGTVKVQVQVNADGTHKVMKVISSTNHGDDAAAMEIAQTSTYRPAHRGATPITTFYDFVLKFNGKSVASDASETAGGGEAAGPIDQAIRNKDYKGAIAKANAALLSTPGNPTILQLLGIAQYYDGDLEASATSFSRVDSVNKDFQPLASQALAAGAVKLSQTNPAQSMTFAQKAVQYANNNNSQFALGVAQLANKQYNDAIATLKGVHDKVTDPKTKLAIDRQLLEGYLDTNNTTDATSTANEMKQLDPAGNTAGVAMGAHYVAAGNQAVNEKNYAEAIKDFDAAAASGDTQVAVTANTLAAFAIFRMDKPDYAKAKDYAMKAVGAGPNDPTANYAAGVAWTGVYASSHSASDKQQALTFLNKADELAKAAGNEGLALQIENQIKNIPH